MLIKTLYDGFHLYDDLMLFNVVNDPHEMNNLAGCSPEIIDEGLSILGGWYQEMMPQAARGRDPLLNVIEEGGPYHVRGQLGDYLARLRDTGREKLAEQLDEKHN